MSKLFGMYNVSEITTNLNIDIWETPEPPVSMVTGDLYPLHSTSYQGKCS